FYQHPAKRHLQGADHRVGGGHSTDIDRKYVRNEFPLYARIRLALWLRLWAWADRNFNHCADAVVQMAWLVVIYAVPYLAVFSSRAVRAISYSRVSRATSSATGTTFSTAPMPWPQPQMSPRFRFLVSAGIEVHLRRIGDRKVIGIHARELHRRTQIVAVHTGEEIGVDDVLPAAGDDHVLISL